MTKEPTKKIISILFLIFLLNSIPSNIYKVDASQNEILNNENIPSNYSNTGLDENITSLMNSGHMPSIVACIVKDDEIVWSKGYGYYDIKNKKEASIYTPYMVASITKTITATAVMQLYEKGFFDLDADVNNYLPFNLRNPNYPEVKITFRMLLAHQSSIAGNNIPLFILYSMLRLQIEDLDKYLIPGGIIYNPKNWLNSPPGSEYEYSSLGYEILEYLIEIISNQPFDEYCNNNIFEPLNMKNSSFHPSDYNLNQVAIPYIWVLGNYIQLPHFEDRNYAAGGLRTNVDDLSHFLIAHMNGGIYKNNRILEEKTIEIMHSLQYTNNRYNHSGYCLGFRMFWNEDFNNSLRIGHTGAMPGSLTYMFYYPADKTGVIFFTNQHLIFRFNEIISWFSIVNLLSETAEEY